MFTSGSRAVQLPLLRGGPATYAPTCIHSLPPCEALCTCVGSGAPAGAGPAPGVVRGKGKNEGHSPTGNPGCLPILYQLLKSMLPMIIVSKVVSLHSPAGVFHAVEGSRPVLLTIGFTAYSSFVQLVWRGSDGSAGCATSPTTSHTSAAKW